MAIKTTHNFINSDFETVEKMQNISLQKRCAKLEVFLFYTTNLQKFLQITFSGALFQIMKFKKVGSL